MKKRFSTISLSVALALVLLLGAGGATVCYAYFPPSPINDVSTQSQLVQWYSTDGDGAAQLKQNIEIKGTLTLGPSGVTKAIHAYDWAASQGFTLRVLPGATLIVDNPKIELGGEKEVITVESGGTLILKRGKLDAGVDETAIAIVVKKGGKLTKRYNFMLKGSIYDEITAPPAVPDTKIPITGIFDDKSHISCVKGKTPDKSQYLDTVYAYFGQLGGAEIPVTWDTSTVDFNKPGTYTVIGRLAQDALNEKNLSNHKNLTAKMGITVYIPGPLKNAGGEVLSVGTKGDVVARLVLPALPVGELKAINLYTSADGLQWKQATIDLFPVDGVIPTSENFLSVMRTEGAHSFIPYYYQTDYRELWVKVVIFGSDRAGESNAVCLELPSGSSPGNKTENGDAMDSGESGGNRGGGGQTEEDRVLPTSPEVLGGANAMAWGEADPPNNGTNAPAAPLPPINAMGEFYGDGAENVPPALENKEEAAKLESNPAAQELAFEAETGGPGASSEAQKQPFQGSRGVLITAVATAVAAACLLLFRKIYKSKRKS